MKRKAKFVPPQVVVRIWEGPTLIYRLDKAKYTYGKWWYFADTGVGPLPEDELRALSVREQRGDGDGVTHGGKRG